MNHGFARFDKGGEVKNAIEGVIFHGSADEKAFNRSTVRQFSFNELDADREKTTLGMTQIVEYNGFVSLRGQ